MATASKSVVNKTQGVIKSIVKTAVAGWNTHTFSSPRVDWIAIQNMGTEDIAIAFDSDDKDASPRPEYRTVKPGVQTPIFGITKDTQMHYKRLTGTGGHRLEITAWG